MGVPLHRIPGGSGFQYARTGVAYIGMFYYNGGDSRNYFQVKLLDSLKAGKCYYAECYVNLGNADKLACNNQAMLFTSQAAYVDTGNGLKILPATPQVINYGNPVIPDTLNWVKVSSVFTAQGGEQYLTVGNFKYNSQTSIIQIQPTGYFGSVYYVDDVSVYAKDSFPLKADAGRDTTIATGDSAFIGSLTNGLTNVRWYDGTGHAIDSTRPGFFVKPTANTFYVIEQTVCGNYSRDTVL
jgi:hypothetical protein